MTSDKKLSSLSIFFPAFNEADNIEKTVQDALDLAPKLTNKYEVLVIDDGSSDQTAQIVQKMADSDSHVRLLSHKVNKGYGAALKTGFYNCKFDYITYMDSDRQFNFSLLNRLVDQLPGNDIVVGYRIKRADNFLRVLNGKLWNLMVSLLLNLRIKDIDCGFKLIRAEVIKQIPKLESNGATISAELLVKAKKQGFKITQVGLEHRRREFGNATGGNPLHIFRAFYDLIMILPKIK